MSWTIKLALTGGDQTYPILAEGFELKTLVGEKGEHATQSVSVSIRSTAATAALLTDTAKFIQAYIYDNANTLVFHGVVRPYVSTAVQYNKEDPLQLEVMDLTETLHIRVCQDLSSYTENAIDYSGVILVDDAKSNESLTSLVSYLFNLAGYTGTISWIAAESRTVEYFVLEDGDYMDEVIAQLLYEYNLDYRFTTTGVEIFPTDLATAVTDTISGLINKMKVTRDDNTTDGVVVNYGDYRVAEHVRILTEDYTHHYDLFSGEDLGYHYDDYLYNKKQKSSAPTAGKRNYSFNLSAYQQNGDKVVALGNFDWGSSLHKNAGGYHTVHHDLESLKYGGARAYIECDTGFWGGWGYKLWCDADVTYLATSTARCGYYGTNPDTITTSFVGTYTKAKALADNHYKRLTSSAIKYTFESRTSYLVGRFYTLTESDVSSLSSKIRILSSAYDPTTGIYKYKAEGADNIAITDSISTLEANDRESSAESSPFRIDVSQSTVNAGTDSIIVTMQGYHAENADSLVLLLNGTQVSTTRQTTLAGSAFAGGENTLEARAYYTGYADYQGAQAKVIRYYTDSEVQQIALTDNSSHIDVYASETLVEYTIRNASSKTVHIYANLVNVTGTTAWTLNGSTYAAAAGLIEFDFTFNTSTSGNFVFVCTAGGYSGSVTIARYSIDQEIYAGFYAADPTDITYIDGDFYFNTTDTQVYRYNGSTWVQVDSSDDEWQEMAACVVGDNSFDENADLDAASIVTLYCKNIAANKATIKRLFSKDINVQTGGYIRGGDRYTDDDTGTISDWSKTGFWFGADGRLMANLQSDNNGNTFVGTDVGLNTVIGQNLGTSGNYNTAVGYQAMYTNTTGDGNVALGYKAMNANTTGGYNIAIGYLAMEVNTGGNTNTAVGHQTLMANLTGSGNCGVGHNALASNTTGGSNVAVGSNALSSNTKGRNNIGIGGVAGGSLSTGDYNCALGYNTGLYSNTGCYQMNFGSAIIHLEFLATRTAGEIYTALHSYYSVDREVGCIGVFNKQPVASLKFTSTQVIIYNNARTALATLSSGSSSTYAGRHIFCFINPGSAENSRASDCLTT